MIDVPQPPCPACRKPIPKGHSHVCPDCWRQVPGKRRVYFYTLVVRKQPFKAVLDQIVAKLKEKFARSTKPSSAAPIQSP